MAILRTIGIIVVILFAIGILLTIFVFTGISQLGADTEGIDVEILPSLSVVQNNFIPITQPIGEDVIESFGIFCKVKQTTLVYGEDARLLETIQSGGIQGSPFIQQAFVSGTDVEIAGYNVLPKIFCSQENNVPVEAFVKEMQLTVRCEERAGGECSTNNNLPRNQIVWSQGVTGSHLATFGSGQGEQTLVNFYVPMERVEANFPLNDFTMIINFEITGTLAVQYSGFTFEYIIPIYRADLETFDQIDILRFSPPTDLDSDGDGFVDSSDFCPNDAETFNGFEDGDGCPDSPQCPIGDIIITDAQGQFVKCEPVNPDPPSTCESMDDLSCSQTECENTGGIWLEDSTGRFYCDNSPDAPEPTMCPIGQSLVAGLCVEDEIIVNGGEEPEVSPEVFLSGQVRSVGTIVFTDLSVQTFVIGDPNFFSSAGTIQPLSVTIPVTGQDKSIERFEYEVFYIYPNTSDALATFLEDTDIRFTPTVIVSSVASETGTSAEGTSDSLGVNGEVQTPEGSASSIGFGLSLGKGIISSKQIQALVTQEDRITGEPAPIPEGQARTVTVQINADGDFTLKRDTTISTFDLSENFGSFKGVSINNNVVLPSIECPSGTEEILDPTTGQLLGCGEADQDGDGVPNDRDQCPLQAGSPFNNGCPADSCPIEQPVCSQGSTFVIQTCRCEVDFPVCASNERFNESKQMCELLPTPPPTGGDDEPCQDGTLTQTSAGEIVCVKGDVVIVGGGNNGQVCTLTTPQFCPEGEAPDIDFNTLLVIGGIAFIIIGVTVAVLRRR